MPTLEIEMRLRSAGHACVAGIDEAGRGPLAGPVLAAAVILPPDFAHALLNDSKQLTEKQRESIYDELKSDARLHIACAALNGVDYLLTWNCKHIANFERLPAVERICRDNGYEPPRICTPAELMGDQ